MLVFDIVYFMFPFLVVKFCSKVLIPEISTVPIVYYFWFWPRKILFQNCSCKVVKVWESRFKHTAILKRRVFGIFKTCFCFTKFFRLYIYSWIQVCIFFPLNSISKSLGRLYFHNLYRVCPEQHLRC